MESREGFCPSGRGRSFHVARGTEDRKGAGTNSGESDTRNMEAESIRRRAHGRVCKFEDSDRDKTEQCA